MSDEARVELFIQDGVLLKKALSIYMPHINKIGSLCVTDICGDKQIEWRTNVVTIIDTETQDPEWTVVESVARRSRTLSGSSVSSATAMAIPFGDIKSFRISNKNRQLTFYDGSSECIASFLFQHGNCDHFVGMLKTLLKTAPSKRDRQLFVILDANNSLETEQLSKSFAELNIFQDSPTTLLGFVKKFHERPYETTFEAFSKVTDFVYRIPEHQAVGENGNDDKEQKTKTLADYDSTAHVHGDYLVIENLKKLPPRKNCPRGKPLTAEQWRGIQDSEGRIEDVSLVKIIIFRGGVVPQLRSEVWKFLLGYYPWDSTCRERQQINNTRKDLYYSMKLQWKSFTSHQEAHFSEYKEKKSLIEKDVNRTDRTLEFFAGDNNPNLHLLSDILMTYLMYNFDLGYVQGMSDLLSPILYVMKDEVTAFWCFVGFMDIMVSNFDLDQSGMKEQLMNLGALLSFVEPQLFSYLEKHESGNVFFCFRWLLVWFKRELSMDDTLKLWEVLWTGLPCANFHLLISVAILESQKETFMENNYEFSEILKHVNELTGKLNVEEMLNSAEGIYYQVKESEHLTNLIRVIVGLPVVPTGSVGSHDGSASGPEMDESTDTQPRCSVEHVRISPEEVVFERSISTNYL